MDSPPESPNYEILLIDDSDGDADLLRLALNDGGLGHARLTRADRLWLGLELLRRNRYDVILLDLSLPDSHGRSTFHALRERVDGCPIVVITGDADDSLGAELVREGAQDCIVKGEFNGHSLSRALRHAVERYHAELALKAAREAALSASRAKSEFVASVSHEIRTPLNVILGMSEVLLGTNLGLDQEEYARIINRAGHTLLDLINNVLDFAKMESSELELRQATFDLHELVESTCEMLAFSAHKKRLALGQRIDPRVPRLVIGDSGRLRQILVNIIANAIKFTTEGHIRLDVEVVPEISNGVCFRVSDTGIGIPADRRESIFESFTQADGSVARRFGGSGLGLTISARLAKVMGGSISVDSTVGKGSEFRAVVQLQPGDAPPRSTNPVPTGQLALVVDDHPLERALLAEALERLGLEVRVAADGMLALDAIESARSALRPFDLVFVDCRMPGTNGFEVVRQMGAPERWAERVVMLLTTDHRRGDIERCQKAGLAGYMLKPCKESTLRELILALQSGERRTVSSCDRGEAPVAHSGLRILMVEDSSDNQLLIRAYLKDTAHEIVEANNGFEAIDRFRNGRFDLILMDMQMPIKDGYSATQEIRALERAEKRPRTRIVALTAHAFEGESEKSFAVGCDEHVTKPISKTRLLEVIEKSSSAPAAASDGGEHCVITPDAEVADMVPDYLMNRRREISTLQEALSGADFERIRILAHNMKGTGAGYGCAPISEIGARMEAAAKIADASAVDDEIVALMDFLSRVQIAGSDPAARAEGRQT